MGRVPDMRSFLSMGYRLCVPHAKTPPGFSPEGVLRVPEAVVRVSADRVDRLFRQG